MKDITPLRMREIMSERSQNVRSNNNNEDSETNTGASPIYHLVGNYVEKVEIRDEPESDTRYYVRLGDTRGTVDVLVTSPLPPSIRIGQPILVFANLVAEGKEDVDRMEDVRPQETLHAVRVVALRQNAAHGYHELVADKLLATNPRIVLPMWLVHWFSESTSCYSDLLRIYLCHNRLEDATFVAVGIQNSSFSPSRSPFPSPSTIFVLCFIFL